MRMRFVSFVVLGVAAAFLVFATAAYTLPVVVDLSLGLGIGMLVISLGIAGAYRRHMPSLITGAAGALASVWTIVASQVYSATLVDRLSFASGLAIAALALIGLTAHELTAERVVHRLEVRSGDRAPDDPRTVVA